MAGLTEDASWEAQIYQLEQTDPVLGGAPNLALGQGFDNVPHQQLARRTLWLKQEVEALASDLAALAGGDFVTTPEMTAAIDAAINALVNGAPGALDTLYELAQELQAQDGALDAILAQIVGKYGTTDRASQADAEAGTSNTKVMTPLSVAWAIAALAPKPLGVAQSYQSPPRAAGTVYVNTTGRPIGWLIGPRNGAAVEISADGSSWVTLFTGREFQPYFDNNPPREPAHPVFLTIPAGHSYRCGTFETWQELR